MTSGRSVSSGSACTACRHQLGLVGQRRAHVHVQQHGAAGHLLLDVDLHPGQVAGRSCSWKIFRPVGLIRSPMIANGWSSPMQTVLVAEDRMVYTVGFPGLVVRR